MSEFDIQNEDSFNMVRANRDCHPKGERVVLASESKCLDMIRKTQDARSEAKELQKQVSELETQKRFWHLVTLVSSVISAAAAFLIGIAL